MNPSRTFLVPSGYNFRAVLAFCRALRQAGARPAIIACTSADPVFRTRFANDVVFTRANRALELVDFAAATQAARLRDGLDGCVLAPSSEYLVRWALQNREHLAVAGCDLPLPDEEVYGTVTDKESFTKLVRDLGLPVPREFPDADPGRLPLVAKPRRNVGSDGRSLYPWLIRSEFELERFRSEEREAEYFFQEWVQGRSFYLLFHVPKLGGATIYSQENLAQQPGGKSIVLARTAGLHLTPEAPRWEHALRAAGFHGLAMIEVRERGGEFVLIEANPRLWGPLQLCVDGCPALVRNYIAEHLGPVPPASRDRGIAHYLWSGGMEAAGNAVWHAGAPRFPRWTLLRRAMSDVYLRADSWRQFLSEHKTPPARVPSQVASLERLAPTH